MSGCPIIWTKRSKLYLIASVIFFYGNYIAVFLDLYHNREVMERAMEDARLIFPITSSICTHIFISFRRNSMERLLRLTESFKWEDLPTKDPDTGYLTMAAWIPLIGSSARKISVFLLSIHIVYIFFRSVYSEDHVLHINAWYPFDTTNSPVFEIMNIYQLTGALMCFCTFTGFVCMYGILICVACSQLEKLRINLLNISQKQMSTDQNSDAEANQEGSKQFHDCQEVSRHMQNQLNKCIQHHQHILMYMDVLEETLNPILLSHFAFIMGGMCFAAFSAVTSEGDLVQLAQVVIIYIAFVCQLYAYCSFGTELTRQAEGISDVAWQSDWIGTSVSYQKCQIFIIERAKKDFTLTAGKFVFVSNNTMLKIVNETISYFMFLLNFKDTVKNE